MSGVEKLKLWFFTFIVLGVVYIISYGDNFSIEVRYGTATIGLMIAAGLIFFSQAGKDFSRFLRDSGVELRKVVWPSRQETMQLTGIVFVFLLVMTSLIWLGDVIISAVVNLLLS